MIAIEQHARVPKRVQQFFNGAIAIKSDNASYAEENVGAAETQDLKVAGRVRWVGRLY